MAPYRVGKGWLANKPWFYGEHQVYDLSDFKVDIELLEPPAGLVIAASAPVQQEGSRYAYTLTNARNFVLSASPFYKVFTQMVGQVTVTSYAFTFDGAAGKAALQHTAASLELYSQIFSPYPHSSMAVVEADFLDGMEYEGLYFLSRGFYNLYNGTPQGYLAAIAAHETAHQWWYASVANDQALEPWLDEALCTYSEYIYYKNVHPEYLKWWWDFRVNYYEPQGKVNLPLYDYTSYRSYRDAVYLNGAHFLDDLRTLTGDEAFYSFLKDYAGTFKGQIVTAANFFSLLKRHTGADYSQLLNKYFK
jgi:aminopeptidase N